MTGKVSMFPHFSPALHVAGRPVQSKSVTPVKEERNAAFSEVLKNEAVRLSHHAEERLAQRGIDLGAEELAKLRNAMERAEQKGAKDSLMLINGVALIVNIKNKTVVTAMDASSMKDAIFTKIDSAVIIS